jgi:hypothetical protein
MLLRIIFRHLLLFHEGVDILLQLALLGTPPSRRHLPRPLLNRWSYLSGKLINALTIYIYIYIKATYLGGIGPVLVLLLLLKGLVGWGRAEDLGGGRIDVLEYRVLVRIDLGLLLLEVRRRSLVILRLLHIGHRRGLLISRLHRHLLIHLRIRHCCVYWRWPGRWLPIVLGPLNGRAQNRIRLLLRHE